MFRPEGILLRNDAAVRRREGLDESVVLARGTVPREVEVREGGIRYLAAPWDGQKTGAFLDQRPNRLLAGALAAPGGRALDCFAYHGSFALHLAGRAGSVLALDASPDALRRGAANAALNGLANIEWREGDAFETLRAFARARERFDTIVLDPPAFAKNRGRGRRRAPRLSRNQPPRHARAGPRRDPDHRQLLVPCPPARLPHHARRRGRGQRAAGASRRILGPGEDHPEILTIPETSYLKGAVLQAE